MEISDGGEVLQCTAEIGSPRGLEARVREFEFGQSHEVRKDAAKVDCACRIQVCGVQIEVRHGCEMRQGTEEQSSTRMADAKTKSQSGNARIQRQSTREDSTTRLSQFHATYFELGAGVARLNALQQVRRHVRGWSARLPSLEPRESVAEG